MAFVKKVHNTLAQPSVIGAHTTSGAQLGLQRQLASEWQASYVDDKQVRHRKSFGTEIVQIT